MLLLLLFWMSLLSRRNVSHENNWISKHPFNHIEENCISSSTVSYNLIMFVSVCLSNDFKGISHWRQIFRTQTQDPMTIVWSNRMANSLHIFILYIYNCISYMLRIYLIIMFNRLFAFSFSFFFLSYCFFSAHIHTFCVTMCQ